MLVVVVGVVVLVGNDVVSADWLPLVLLVGCGCVSSLVDCCDVGAG
jgi:hypothetical protein